jgi:adsorption protein B
MTGLLFAASKTSQAFPAPVPMLYLTSLLLVWRLSIRALCVGHHYGWRCGLISVPRTFVSNIVAMLAARDALIGYTAYLRTGHLAWNKARHRSPLDP